MELSFLLEKAKVKSIPNSLIFDIVTEKNLVIRFSTSSVRTKVSWMEDLKSVLLVDEEKFPISKIVKTLNSLKDVGNIPKKRYRLSNK